MAANTLNRTWQSLTNITLKNKMSQTSFGPIALIWLVMSAGSLCQAAPPQIGERTPVITERVDDREPCHAAVAYDGEGTYLVVWQQGVKYFEGPDPVVLAARLSARGQPLDMRPLTLATVKGAQERPQVAFAGDQFVVAWQQLSGDDWDLAAVRVTPAGKVLDREPLLIAGGPGSQCLPSVAASTDQVLIGWQDRSSGKQYEPRVATLSAAGEVHPPGGAPLELNGERALGGSVLVTRAGGSWFANWRNDASWRPGVRVDFFGRVTLEGKTATVVGDRTPPGMYDLYPCNLAGGPERVLLTSGGAQRSTRICKGIIYDAASGQLLTNPNDDSSHQGGSGWNTEHSILLLAPLVPGFSPPISIGSSGNEFLVAVRSRGTDNPNRPAPDPLRVLRLSADGKRLDDVENLPILDDGETPCSQPAVAGDGRGGYVVVYRSGNEPGKVQIVVRTVQSGRAAE